MVAQILLTRDVVEDSVRRKNVSNTFINLLERGIVSIVNENDTVSVEEIENIKNFGDNDTLSAVVSKLIKADLLIILSDIDGFFETDPRKNKNSKMLKIVNGITPEIEKAAGGIGSARGTGGMATKISAAKIAISGGAYVVLANGSKPEIIIDILNGSDVGTLFVY